MGDQMHLIKGNETLKNGRIRHENETYPEEFCGLVLRFVLNPMFFLLLTANVSMAFAQSNLPEQDKYVKKQYLFIPWGIDKGTIPLTEKTVVNIRGPEPVTVLERHGVNYFKVDNLGNVYVSFFDQKSKKSVVKKFSSKGNETAYCNGISANKLFFDNGNIISTNTSRNSVLVLDENLKTIREINVSKDFPVGKCYVENGVAFNIDPRAGEKDKFVYDESATAKQVGIKTQQEMNRFYQFDDNKRKKKLVFKNGKFKDIRLLDYLTDSVWDLGPHSYDRYGNLFLKTNYGSSISYRSPNIMKEVGVLKISPKGQPLCWIKLDRDMFALYITFEVPWTVDINGNVYGGESEQDGFHIYQWSLNTRK